MDLIVRITGMNENALVVASVLILLAFIAGVEFGIKMERRAKL